MFTGTQKAAMLIMNLDSATATELLKGLEPEEIQAIAAELARIKMSGRRDTEEEAKITQEFCDSLQKGQTNIFSMKTFFNETLVDVLDKERAYQIQTQVQMSSDKKDLFADIRMASIDELVMALKGEHPQTIAVVLSEIATSKSQAVLSRLSEDARSKTVCRMTNPELVGIGVKQRMAVTVSERLRSFKGETLIEKPEQALRKLALVLSGLEKDIRDQLLDEITKHDEEAATMVKRLMITWSDILSIADRSLQEALRSVEPGKLALAIHGAEEAIVEKIRSNISERAVAMLDEEISLMQEPLEKEVLEAREEVVAPLREANEEGKLRMVGR
jgi:flagellar motor switch protein FliG